jgi:serine/threonine protein kinase
MAPEVLLRQNHSFCVDFFAVGIIGYELAVGKRPFEGKDRKQIRD